MNANPGTNSPTSRWHIIAALAAWLLPGLGHILVGQRRRGYILGSSILGLWLAGLVMGGISCIEIYSHIEIRTQQQRSTDRFRAWFLGQMLLAPSLAVAWYHTQLRNRVPANLGTQRQKQNYFAMVDYSRVPLPDDTPPYFEPSYGRVNEQAVLYTALAGMLNLLAIIDVLYRDPKTELCQAGTHVGSEMAEIPA